MSAGEPRADVLLGADLSRPHRVGLRVVVGVAPIVALLLTGLVGVGPPVWLVGLTVALSIGFAALPDTPFGTAVLGLVVLWWGLACSQGDSVRLPAWSIVAGVLVLGAHVGATVLAYGPASMPVDPGLARLWLRRALVVAPAAPLVWLLARALVGRPEPPGIWVAGLVAATAVCVVASVAIASLEGPLVDPRDPGRRP